MPPPPPPQLPLVDAETLKAEHEAALAEAVGAVFKDDRPLAKALGDALGGKGVVDQDALNELLDTAEAGDLDSAEKDQLRDLVQAGLEKRARKRQQQQPPPPPPPPPPRLKSSAEREWHLTAYQDVCNRYLRAAELDFTESVATELGPHVAALAELAKQAAVAAAAGDGGGAISSSAAASVATANKVGGVVDGGRLAVVTSSCTDVCNDEPASAGGSATKPKKLVSEKSKKKTRTKKRKKEKASPGARGSEL